MLALALSAITHAHETTFPELHAILIKSMSHMQNF